MSHRPIDIFNSQADHILNEWINISSDAADELYKCSKCFGMELVYCHPNHKNGIQACLAVDATPQQGGIAFFTNTGCNICFCYQPNFTELGIEINRAKPIEFEMINLLLALFIFKREILNHKSMRIIVDNNFLRARGERQRNHLTKAIANILERCDDSGCIINEVFLSNEPTDVPFLKVADRLSRNKAIKEWLKDGERLSSKWNAVSRCDYKNIPISKTNLITPTVVRLINGKLQQPYYVPESYSRYPCRRFERMMSSFETLPETQYLQRHQSNRYVPSEVPSFTPDTTVTKPEESNWFWTILCFACLCILIWIMASSEKVERR